MKKYLVSIKNIFFVLLFASSLSHLSAQQNQILNKATIQDSAKITVQWKKKSSSKKI